MALMDMGMGMHRWKVYSSIDDSVFLFPSFSFFFSLVCVGLVGFV